MTDWGPARDIATLSAMELEGEGAVFHSGPHLFRTTGEHVGQGGMGSAHLLQHRKQGDKRIGRAVAKIYRWEFLVQLKDDPTARRHFEHNLEVLSRVQAMANLHLLPILVSQRLETNHVIVTPHAGEPLVRCVLEDKLPAKDRVRLLLQAVRGLRALHDHQVLHGDFTLRNILVDLSAAGSETAVLFDFDLSVALDRLGPISYQDHYDGRIVGAPEYSVPPELLDPILLASPVSPRRDVYAVGTALFNLFTDASVYGEVNDLPSLLQCIADGVVRKGDSRVPFPDDVPVPICEVINRCLERDPLDRYADGVDLVRAIELAHGRMNAKAVTRFHSTLDYVHTAAKTKLKDIFEKRPDETVTIDDIREMQATLSRYGYLLEKSLGKVKDYPIYLAAPDPMLVATGRFQEANTYRKIVTCIDLRDRNDADAYVAIWLGRIKPILDGVRAAHLTALHRVAMDRPSGRLLLFSEYLDDARFGTDLAAHDLTLEEVLGLSLILCAQIGQLHAEGLAHNNVMLASLILKGIKETGEAKPMLVGLVEPSFDKRAVLRDVRRLAGMVFSLLRPARVAEQTLEIRAPLLDLIACLDGVARGRVTCSTLLDLQGRIDDGLALLDANFDLIRRHGGAPLAYAQLLTQRALYRRLWLS
jgi:serine/threonine protein kinase